MKPLRPGVPASAGFFSGKKQTENRNLTEGLLWLQTLLLIPQSKTLKMFGEAWKCIVIPEQLRFFFILYFLHII
jgi:hypothetical protein